MHFLLKTLAAGSLLNMALSVNASTNLYWGDTHLHTSYSLDAFMLNNRSADPETAYRFAKGLPVIHPGHGALVRLQTPLDFLVVTDHAEWLGVMAELASDNPALVGTEQGRLYRTMLDEEGGGNKVFSDVLEKANTDPQKIAFLNDEKVRRSAWESVIDAAEKHNDPGKFTAFIGWEWSALPNGMNLHRIVFTPDGKQKAMQYLPYSLFDSEKPRDLWNWLAETAEEANTDFVAIGHNPNLSNDRFFPLLDESGNPVDETYAKLRERWEPVEEVTQYKGDSESDPVLSPNDEFAGFEPYRHLLGSGEAAGKVVPSAGSFARNALLRGMELEQKIGTNPYKFGMIGSTDSHTGLSSAEENNFLGKYAQDSTPEAKHLETVPGSVGWDASAQGLAGVWAKENTREAITAAFKRKEVFASTGPRIELRVFAGWNFKTRDKNAKNFAEAGYSKGVPMGGDLTKAPNGKAPKLLIRAVKDPVEANLDRIQVIKGWVDSNGKHYEQIYNVAWSGDRKPDNQGNLPPVGNTVDLKKGTFENSIGSGELVSLWEDPDFDPQVSSFYYVRVLQIPTPRHTVLDTIALQQPTSIMGDHATTIQERAYSSPIWYTP